MGRSSCCLAISRRDKGFLSLKNFMKKLLSLLMMFYLISCSQPKIDYEYPQDPAIARRSRAGGFLRNSFTFSGKKVQDQNKVNPKIDDAKTTQNNPLWLASFEVISNLLPIATADYNAGIIVTDWYQKEKNVNERMKISLLIKPQNLGTINSSKQYSSDSSPTHSSNQENKNECPECNLLISIFKQKKSSDGTWQDDSTFAESSENKMLTQLIKEKIINKSKSY